MERFAEGDRVRIDIPDERDPDYAAYHGEHGTVVDVIPDEADAVTGDERDAVIYRVELKSGEQADFRWRDLRPPFTDS
jgi:ribosomal protein L21E